MGRPTYLIEDRYLAVRDGETLHSVVGDPVNFYVWSSVRYKGGASRWIKGQHSTWLELSRLVNGRKRDKFVELVEKLAREHAHGKC